MYSTYQRNFSINSECEADPSAKKKIIILGGGPNRIGQGIEFDYCCCQASFALKDAGFETIMINCNPETVSTDYDTSDRLYFEPLKEEYVFNIIKKEKEKGNLIGIIAQFGGQTPIKLAKFLHDNKLPILGTQYTSIDLAEDRDLFRNLLNKLKLKQAESGIAKTFKQAIQIAEKIGLPLMVRPSYVLGGRAMEIVHEKSQLKNFVEEAFKAAEENAKEGSSLKKRSRSLTRRVLSLCVTKVFIRVFIHVFIATSSRRTTHETLCDASPDPPLITPVWSSSPPPRRPLRPTPRRRR
jgi:carbamoyl-phosphate synthase large subunit